MVPGLTAGGNLCDEFMFVHISDVDKQVCDAMKHGHTKLIVCLRV